MRSTPPAFPKLESATVAEPATRCGSWLVRIGVCVADVSDSSGVWWKDVIVPAAMSAYQEYTAATAIVRLGVKVKVLEDSMKYTRVRAKGKQPVA